METIIVYTDGGARGNPGPSAVGVHITKSNGEVVGEVKKAIGNATNNFAEYYAVMLALQTLKQMYGDETNKLNFEIRLGSELVKKQLNSEYQINEPGLIPMFIEIHNMRISSFPNLTLILVPHEQNKEADRLMNEALDGK